MSTRSDEALYEKVINQLMNLNTDYKNIKNLTDFKLTIKNIVNPLFRGQYEVSRANDYIYIGHVFKENRQFQPDVMIPHGIGIQIKYDRSYRIGKWALGKIYGYLHCKYPDGSIYHGEFNNSSKPEGYGMCVIPGKSMYEGEWLDGKNHGLGLVIKFIDGTKNLLYVDKGYFDMGKQVGIHIQSIIANKETFLINNDFNTKIKVPDFILPNLFKQLNIAKYQPIPPRLTGNNINTDTKPNGQDIKAANVRARNAIESVMTPEELKIYKAKVKVDAINALKLKTLAKKKETKTKYAQTKPEIVKSEIIKYEINPDDVSSGEELDNGDNKDHDITDDEKESSEKKYLKKESLYYVDNTCILCMNNEIDTIILECGHLAICFSCSKDPLFKQKCPICRQPIERIKQFYKAR